VVFGGSEGDLPLVFGLTRKVEGKSKLLTLPYLESSNKLSRVLDSLNIRLFMINLLLTNDYSTISTSSAIFSKITVG